MKIKAFEPVFYQLQIKLRDLQLNGLKDICNELQRLQDNLEKEIQFASSTGNFCSAACDVIFTLFPGGN